MAEYIEREAAIKAIYESDHFSVRECFGWSAREIEEVLRAVPATPVPQWISVKDRLPEAEQEVLVISRGWGDRLLYVGQYKKMEAQTSPLTGITSKESDWLLWGWSYMKKPQVTHWMPLPEPPKGENDD